MQSPQDSQDSQDSQDAQTAQTTSEPQKDSEKSDEKALVPVISEPKQSIENIVNCAIKAWKMYSVGDLCHKDLLNHFDKYGDLWIKEALKGYFLFSFSIEQMEVLQKERIPLWVMLRIYLKFAESEISLDRMNTYIYKNVEGINYKSLTTEKLLHSVLLGLLTQNNISSEFQQKIKERLKDIMNQTNSKNQQKIKERLKDIMNQTNSKNEQETNQKELENQIKDPIDPVQDVLNTWAENKEKGKEKATHLSAEDKSKLLKSDQMTSELLEVCMKIYGFLFCEILENANCTTQCMKYIAQNQTSPIPHPQVQQAMLKMDPLKKEQLLRIEDIPSSVVHIFCEEKNEALIRLVLRHKNCTSESIRKIVSKSLEKSHLPEDNLSWVVPAIDNENTPESVLEDLWTKVWKIEKEQGIRDFGGPNGGSNGWKAFHHPNFPEHLKTPDPLPPPASAPKSDEEIVLEVLKKYEGNYGEDFYDEANKFSDKIKKELLEHEKTPDEALSTLVFSEGVFMAGCFVNAIKNKNASHQTLVKLTNSVIYNERISEAFKTLPFGKIEDLLKDPETHFNFLELMSDNQIFFDKILNHPKCSEELIQKIIMYKGGRSEYNLSLQEQKNINDVLCNPKTNAGTLQYIWEKIWEHPFCRILVGPGSPADKLYSHPNCPPQLKEPIPEKSTKSDKEIVQVLLKKHEGAFLGNQGDKYYIVSEFYKEACKFTVSQKELLFNEEFLENTLKQPNNSKYVIESIVRGAMEQNPNIDSWLIEEIVAQNSTNLTNHTGFLNKVVENEKTNSRTLEYIWEQYFNKNYDANSLGVYTEESLIHKLLTHPNASQRLKELYDSDLNVAKRLLLKFSEVYSETFLKEAYALTDNQKTKLLEECSSDMLEHLICDVVGYFCTESHNALKNKNINPKTLKCIVNSKYAGMNYDLIKLLELKNRKFLAQDKETSAHILDILSEDEKLYEAILVHPNVMPKTLEYISGKIVQKSIRTLNFDEFSWVNEALESSKCTEIVLKNILKMWLSYDGFPDDEKNIKFFESPNNPIKSSQDIQEVIDFIVKQKDFEDATKWIEFVLNHKETTWVQIRQLYFGLKEVLHLQIENLDAILIDKLFLQNQKSNAEVLQGIWDSWMPELKRDVLNLPDFDNFRINYKLMMEHPCVTEQIVKENKLNIEQIPENDLEEMKNLSSNDMRIINLVLFEKNFHPEVVALRLSQLSLDGALALARNEKTNSIVLDHLARTHSYDLILEVLNHKNTNSETIRDLHKRIFIDTINTANTVKPEDLDLKGNTVASSLQKGIASHPNCPEDVAKILYFSKNLEVKSAAIKILSKSSVLLSAAEQIVNDQNTQSTQNAQQKNQMENLTSEVLEQIEQIRKNPNSVNWRDISINKTLSESFIKEFQNKVNWIYISENQKLSESFIKEFQNKVNWDWISRYQKLSESFIKEFQNKVNWGCISAYQKLSESFIKEFQNKVNWGCISAYQKLSESFIKEFQDKVDWVCISANQKLSESFIKEFQDKVDWVCISANQKLSENFVSEIDVLKKQIKQPILTTKQTEQNKNENKNEDCSGKGREVHVQIASFFVNHKNQLLVSFSDNEGRPIINGFVYEQIKTYLKLDQYPQNSEPYFWECINNQTFLSKFAKCVTNVGVQKALENIEDIMDVAEIQDKQDKQNKKEPQRFFRVIFWDKSLDFSEDILFEYATDWKRESFNSLITTETFKNLFNDKFKEILEFISREEGDIGMILTQDLLQSVNDVLHHTYEIIHESEENANKSKEEQKAEEQKNELQKNKEDNIHTLSDMSWLKNVTIACDVKPDNVLMIWVRAHPMIWVRAHPWISSFVFDDFKKYLDAQISEKVFLEAIRMQNFEDFFAYEIKNYGLIYSLNTFARTIEILKHLNTDGALPYKQSHCPQINDIKWLKDCEISVHALNKNILIFAFTKNKYTFHYKYISSKIISRHFKPEEMPEDIEKVFCSKEFGESFAERIRNLGIEKALDFGETDYLNAKILLEEKVRKAQIEKDQEKEKEIEPLAALSAFDSVLDNPSYLKDKIVQIKHEFVYVQDVGAVKGFAITLKQEGEPQKECACAALSFDNIKSIANAKNFPSIYPLDMEESVFWEKAQSETFIKMFSYLIKNYGLTKAVQSIGNIVRYSDDIEKNGIAKTLQNSPEGINSSIFLSKCSFVRDVADKDLIVFKFLDPYGVCFHQKFLGAKIIKEQNPSDEDLEIFRSQDFADKFIYWIQHKGIDEAIVMANYCFKEAKNQFVGEKLLGKYQKEEKKEEVPIASPEATKIANHHHSSVTGSIEEKGWTEVVLPSDREKTTNCTYLSQCSVSHELLNNELWGFNVYDPDNNLFYTIYIGTNALSEENRNAEGFTEIFSSTRFGEDLAGTISLRGREECINYIDISFDMIRKEIQGKKPLSQHKSCAETMIANEALETTHQQEEEKNLFAQKVLNRMTCDLVSEGLKNTIVNITKKSIPNNGMAQEISTALDNELGEAILCGMLALGLPQVKNLSFLEGRQDYIDVLSHEFSVQSLEKSGRSALKELLNLIIPILQSSLKIFMDEPEYEVKDFSENEEPKEPENALTLVSNAG
jgi:hypothetical protein